MVPATLSIYGAKDTPSHSWRSNILPRYIIHFLELSGDKKEKTVTLDAMQIMDGKESNTDNIARRNSCIGQSAHNVKSHLHVQVHAVGSTLYRGSRSL